MNSLCFVTQENVALVYKINDAKDLFGIIKMKFTQTLISVNVISTMYNVFNHNLG